MSETKIIGAAAFLSAGKSRRYGTVECPQLGGAVRLRSLTVAERDELDQWVSDQKGNVRGFRTRVLQAVVCDGDGTPFLREIPAETLASLPADVVEPVFEAALPFAGISKADLKAIEGN